MDQLIKEKLIRQAMLEAQKAIESKNSPFGAVISDLEGNIIASAHNTTNTQIDPTAHAEINVIKKATKTINSKDLSNYYLISNAQSCPMCFSAAIRSGIKNFIYGYGEDKTLVPKIDVFELSKHCKDKINIETRVLEKECKEQIVKARKT